MGARRWLWRHAPLVLSAVIAAATLWWGWAIRSDTVIAVSANVWGVVVLLVVFDITPRNAREKQEQR